MTRERNDLPAPDILAPAEYPLSLPAVKATAVVERRPYPSRVIEFATRPRPTEPKVLTYTALHSRALRGTADLASYRKTLQEIKDERRRARTYARRKRHKKSGRRQSRDAGTGPAKPTRLSHARKKRR